MKNIFKKALSFFLAVIMTVGMFPVTVFATEDVVYISVSKDDKFVKDSKGGYIACVEVPLAEVAAVDLETYGLGEYLYDKDADGQYETTALQLIIYAHENIYGGEWSNVTFTGGPGSSYFEGGIFGFDENLNYFHNGEFPIDEKLTEEYGYPTGATSDRIVISAGDYIDMGSFTSWDFYSDSGYGFHKFADSEGKFVNSYIVNAGEELSVKLVRSYSGMGSDPVVYDEAYYTVFYGKEYGNEEGTVSTDATGGAKITFDEAGTYYLWCNGGYGNEFPDSIVSTPAFAKIIVKGEEKPKTTISFDKTTLSVTEGKTAEIKATVSPEEKATELVWSSSDETIATVDQNGVVTGVKVGEATITAKIGDVTAECKVSVTEEKSYLSGLDFYVSARDSNNQPYKMYFPFEPEFSDEVYEYTVYVPDNKSRVDIVTGLSGFAPEDSKIVAKYININTSKISEKEWTESSFFVNYFIKSNSVGTGEFTIEAGSEADFQTYKIRVKRTPTLSKLSVTDKNGGKVKITPSSFKADVTEYTATTAFDEVTIDTTPTVKDAGYVVTYNGSESNVVALAEGENNIEIKVKNTEGYEKTYNLKVTRTPASKVKFSVSPSDAVVFVMEKGKNRVWPNENGEFSFIPGVEYTYNVTSNGYIGKTGTVTVEEDAVIGINLEKTKETAFTEYPSGWPSFGFNSENNTVINRPTPTSKEETALYWATKVVEVSNIGGESNYSRNPVGVPILINDYLYTYAKNKLFKIDKMNGEILEMGTMSGGTSTYAICSLAYGEGLIFVGLNGGTVQAFNAETLESVWIYHDSLGGQPNGQLTYNDGYLYTGFWNGESSEANYACVSVTDEDTEKPDEEKIATWTHKQMGGFYWAGAYIDDNFVYIGTDDGSAEMTNTNTHLISLDKRTGKVVDDAVLPGGGDIRCSITMYEGKLYFTSKGGYFYEAEYNAATGDIGNIRYIKLENGSNRPAMSTSTPTIYNGRAYIGASGSGQFDPYSGHNITVIDIPSWSIAYSVPTQGYPQTTGTLTTYYEEKDGYVYVYFFDNEAPGKLRVLADKPGMTEPLKTIEETTNGKTYEVAYSVFEPAGAMAQYCICTPIIDEDGTLYFKNDSGYLFAVGSAVEYIEVTKNPEKTTYEPGETFDPTGMEVTAYYYNGTERDITKYVSWSTEPLTEEDENFMIVYENVGSDEKPYDIIELSINDGFIHLVPEKEPTKTKIRLNDTVKFDNTIDTPETFFVKDPKGGVFYVGILSDMEYDEFELHTNGYLKGQLIDFDPEKYRSIGETYCVYNSLTGEIAEKEAVPVAKSMLKAGIRPENNKATGMTYDKAIKLAEHLNDENRVTYYKVKCEQTVYVAKITVPENYSTAYKSGTYKITAEKDGVKYSSAENKIVTDVSIFEYEYLKWATANDKVQVMDEDARGYSDYLSDKYGYGDEEYAPPLWEKPTVVSSTAFRAVRGKKMVLACGEGVKITIPEISTMQRGINFIYKNTVGEPDEEKKTTVYNLNFYGKQPVQSDFIIEWKLGVNAFELRESFKIKVEEEDIITYYILKDGKYFDEFTVDYMTDDLNEDITLTLENEGGTTLGNYTITTKKPADADSANDSEEINPNTGAPIF